MQLKETRAMHATHKTIKQTLQLKKIQEYKNIKIQEKNFKVGKFKNTKITKLQKYKNAQRLRNTTIQFES